MPIMYWKEEFTVGKPLIDNQHKKIIELINMLFDAMKEGKGNDVLEKIFDELANYTVYHFSLEEEFMRKSGYDKYEEHKAEHDKLKAKVVEMKTLLTSKQNAISLVTMNFLRDWLSNHILVVDKQTHF